MAFQLKILYSLKKDSFSTWIWRRYSSDAILRARKEEKDCGDARDDRKNDRKLENSWNLQLQFLRDRGPQLIKKYWCSWQIDLSNLCWWHNMHIHSRRFSINHPYDVIISWAKNTSRNHLPIGHRQRPAQQLFQRWKLLRTRFYWTETERILERMWRRLEKIVENVIRRSRKLEYFQSV